MMALCYMLVYLLCNGEAVYNAPEHITDNKEVFLYILKMKHKLTTDDLAKGIDDSGHFKLFLDHIFNLSFTDAPDY